MKSPQNSVKNVAYEKETQRPVKRTGGKMGKYPRKLRYVLFFSRKSGTYLDLKKKPSISPEASSWYCVSD